VKTVSPTEGPPAGQLPTALSVEQAAARLGIGRTLAYELIRTGQWPTPILHLGRLIKIPSGPLISLLRNGQLPEVDAASVTLPAEHSA
jgi:excisionase family DNA binding protein